MSTNFDSTHFFIIYYRFKLYSSPRENFSLEHTCLIRYKPAFDFNTREDRVTRFTRDPRGVISSLQRATK